MDSTYTLTLMLAILPFLFFSLRGYYLLCRRSGPLQAKSGKRFYPLSGTLRSLGFPAYPPDS